MQFQKSGLKPSCQTIPSLRITRGLARTTHGKLVWMPEKYAQQFWGCQEKRQRSCASVSGRSKFGNPKGIRLVRGARSDTQKVTDEGISYEPYGRDQQVECRTGVQLPTGVEQLPNWDVFLFPAKKGSPGDTPGPWGENITGTLFQTAVLELNQLFTIYYLLFTNTVGRAGGCSVGERQGTALPSRPALHHQAPLLRTARFSR